MKSKRPETRTMRFGSDWRGLFLRGDNAFAYFMLLSRVINYIDGGFIIPKVERRMLSSLRELLAEANEQEVHDDEVQTQQMKPFDQCEEEQHGEESAVPEA